MFSIINLMSKALKVTLSSAKKLIVCLGLVVFLLAWIRLPSSHLARAQVNLGRFGTTEFVKENIDRFPGGTITLLVDPYHDFERLQEVARYNSQQIEQGNGVTIILRPYGSGLAMTGTPETNGLAQAFTGTVEERSC